MVLLEPTGSLTSQAYARFRTDILSGALEPGRKLKVEELRSAYGVGIGPIREALTLLVSDRLVERIDQRGFRVVGISVAEFEELLRTRRWLEDRALRESIALGGTEWEERIVLAFYHLSRLGKSLEQEIYVVNPEWEEMHKEFHRALIAACGSSILIGFCEQLSAQNERYRRLAGDVAHAERNVRTEHREIMEASLDRDTDRATTLLAAHYSRTGDFLRRRVSELDMEREAQ